MTLLLYALLASARTKGLVPLSATVSAPLVEAAPAPLPALDATVAPQQLGLTLSLARVVNGRLVSHPLRSPLCNEDRLQLHLEAREAGHLHLYNRSADGAWRRLFPLGGDGYLSAGPHILPSETEFYRVTDPAGPEALLLSLSSQAASDPVRALLSGLTGGAPVVSAVPVYRTKSILLDSPSFVLAPQDNRVAMIELEHPSRCPPR